ncbi:transcription factor TBF1 [Eurytemora carolleeae]|uniref:transcription factor TBF1 n=1 Tax=Eurytemora carolleeae TaxID=1294199 RepID=UPI000C76C9F6|nr:transcription factor TBF1 [Eurytemora carolleeae]|eukprot:XP_023345946.1 transcription factor TBF1-like [Eurytemora affinis]
MGSDQFCLKWNDYHSSLTAEVSKIRDEDDFFDISLGTNDGKAESCALASALPRDEGRKTKKVPVEPEEESAAPASKKQRTESPVVVTPELQEPSSPTEPEEQEEQDQDQEQEQDQDQDQDQEQEQEHTLSVKAEFNSTEKSALHNNSNSQIDDEDSNSAHSNLIDCLVQET